MFRLVVTGLLILNLAATGVVGYVAVEERRERDATAEGIPYTRSAVSRVRAELDEFRRLVEDGNTSRRRYNELIEDYCRTMRAATKRKFRPGLSDADLYALHISDACVRAGVGDGG